LEEVVLEHGLEGRMRREGVERALYPVKAARWER
jgi:hypothetical protein